MRTGAWLPTYNSSIYGSNRCTQGAANLSKDQPKKGNMTSTETTNPILPAPGVSRCHTVSSTTHPKGNSEVDSLNSNNSERLSTDGEVQETVKSLLKAKKNLIFSTNLCFQGYLG